MNVQLYLRRNPSAQITSIQTYLMWNQIYFFKVFLTCSHAIFQKQLQDVIFNLDLLTQAIPAALETEQHFLLTFILTTTVSDRPQSVPFYSLEADAKT